MPRLEITVDLKELAADQGWPALAAYVFTRAGKLLARQKLEQDRARPTVGHAAIDVDAAGPAVIKIGPAADDVAELDKQNASVHAFEISAGQKNALTVELQRPVWICWLKKPYLVTGDVASAAGPICVGEVDIYDVDVGCLLRLAEPLIERLRDSLIDVILDPPPVKLHGIPWWQSWDDDEYAGSPPTRPRPLTDAQITRKLESLPLEWRLAPRRFAAVKTAKARVSRLLAKMPLPERQAWLNREAAPGIKISDLLNSTTVQFRELLVSKFEAVRFWLCWYPWIYWLWWPWCWYSLEKLGTATLGAGGKFSRVIWLSPCRTDTPDLWFVVRQTIGGSERVIYARHPVPCNTYWNHPSGKPVHLTVTDALAVACSQSTPVHDPNVYVLPLGISFDEWHQIHQAHLKPPSVADASCGLYNTTDPYGTTLHFTMQFHDGLRGINVRYYRWSYRKAGTSDWFPINTAIVHRYLTLDAMSKYVIETEKLGPTTVGSESNLFLVRDPAKAWIATDNVFAIWPTAAWDAAIGRYAPLVSDGVYQLRLEMFNSAGAKVTPGGAGFKFLLLTGAGAGAVDDALHVEVDGSILLNLHVDNRYTVADIESVALGGVPAAECQFLGYTDKNVDHVGITYVAYHPNNFLDHYDLKVLRGISGSAEGSISSTTPAAAATTQSFAVKDLLDTFDQCAFAAELHTWPRTRDGISRIRAYEAHDTSAFALWKK